MHNCWPVLLAASLASGQQFGLDLRRLPYGAPLQSLYALAGDLDSDGDVDLLVYSAVAGVTPARFYRNEGDGRFVDETAGRLPTAGPTVLPIATDVDRDGDLDLIVGQLVVWRNDGAGRFTVEPGLSWLGQISSILDGDLDLDGDVDLVFCADGNQPQTAVLRNDGQGRFSVWTGTGLYWMGNHRFRLADLDGDGDLDAIGGEYSYRLGRNDGTGLFTVTDLGLPAAALDLAVGDLDGDGDLDLLQQGELRLWLNRGDASFTLAPAGSVPVIDVTQHRILTADVDLDCDLDIVLLPQFTDQTRLFLNDGTARFVDATPSRLPQLLHFPRGTAMADFDGDEDPDLFIADFLFPEHVLVNQHFHADIVRQVRLGTTVRLDLAWMPGYAGSPGIALAMAGAPLLPAPVRLPGLGTVSLDPLHAVSVASGPFDPTGRFQANLLMPTAAWLAGQDFVVQGALLGPAPHLTNHVRVLFLP